MLELKTLKNELKKKIPTTEDLKNLVSENLNHPKVISTKKQIEDGVKELGQKSLQNTIFRTQVNTALKHKMTEQAIEKLSTTFPQAELVKKISSLRGNLLEQLNAVPKEPSIELKTDPAVNKPVKKSVAKAKAKKRAAEALNMAAAEAGVFTSETSTNAKTTLDSEDTES